MALTPQLAAAYDQLTAMNEQIAQSEANLRVLESINAPEAIKLRSDLAAAKTKRDNMLAAIDTERSNP